MFKNKDDIIKYPEFHISCINDNNMLIDLFLKSGIYNLNQKFGDYQFTPLMILIFKEILKVLKFF